MVFIGIFIINLGEVDVFFFIDLGIKILNL